MRMNHRILVSTFSALLLIRPLTANAMQNGPAQPGSTPANSARAKPGTKPTQVQQKQTQRSPAQSKNSRATIAQGQETPVGAAQAKETRISAVPVQETSVAPAQPKEAQGGQTQVKEANTSLVAAKETPIAPPATKPEPRVRTVRIADLMTVEGLRDNPLLGYGLTVGLNGTGDRQQTVFSMQTLASILHKMGVQVPGATILARNVASVFVTANLPPFAHPGTRIDVNISSTGDAKSLEGGTLLLTPLYAADGQAYAVAQGPLVLGGYSAGGRANAVQVNHPTGGRIPSGAIVERDTSLDLSQMKKVSLLLREPDFSAVENAALVINEDAGQKIATAIDGVRVEVNMSAMGRTTVPELLARIENLSVAVHPPAKVVVNERTGTVVMGKDVSLGAVSILHGTLAVEITTVLNVFEPPPLSNGQTVIAPQRSVDTQESPAHRVELHEGATVEDLVNGLQAIGATSRDIIAILEAIKAAGALQAELQVI